MSGTRDVVMLMSGFCGGLTERFKWVTIEHTGSKECVHLEEKE